MKKKQPEILNKCYFVEIFYEALHLLMQCWFYMILIRAWNI